MCAILDASCLHKVFGKKDRPEAGVKFFEWFESRGTLVVGGKLLKELCQNGINRRFSQGQERLYGLKMSEFINKLEMSCSEIKQNRGNSGESFPNLLSNPQ